MNTPIYDFVKAYSEKNGHRLHMPGHKGHIVLGLEGFDITEIKGADSLYEPASVIAESEKNAAELFGSGRSFYSTEGSSQCIKAMLYLAIQGKQAEGKPVIIAARNVHRAFLSGVALLGIEVRWFWPKADGSSLCSGEYCADKLENLINETVHEGKNLCGVYVTTPDYLGKMQDLKMISKICRGYNVPLMVDNAHGAYLHFLEKPCHPMDYYADMCCDSAHKTLPVITGGAYLHISKTAEKRFADSAKAAMLLFGSTSPSYLIMSSMDLCNLELAEDYTNKLNNCIEKLNRLKATLIQAGYVLYGDEPCKLTIDLCATGIDFNRLSEALRKADIEPEYVDRDFVVFMLSPYNNDEDYSVLEKTLLGFAKTNKIGKTKMEKAAYDELASQCATVMTVSVSEAVMSEWEMVKTEDSEGRIVAQPDFTCPPAVCVCAPGEKITEAAIKVLQYYGKKEVCVIKRKNIETLEGSAKCQGVIAYVDGSFEKKTETYSYACVILEETNGEPGEELASLSGAGNDPDIAKIRNVAGEMLGAMNAVRWAKGNKYKSIVICYDYMGIEMWATGGWKAKNEYTQSYTQYMRKSSQEIKIIFKKIAAHTGNKYNEQADKLAKRALEADSTN